ncbi:MULTISPECIES: transposase [unclassified Kocuria]|uniref:transposase n=1 Tax=unclassified Kocuria TaxID=2649579 RepID=UPI0028832335|nr:MULTISPECIES: transposase [unclassified Kocuria]
MVPTPPPGSSTASPGRSGSAYRDWLDERGEASGHRVEIATLDPFQGCKNAIDDQLEDATCVLDAFHIVKLAGAEVEVAYQCSQDVREVFHQPTLPRGRRLAEQLIEKVPSCLISEIARLGKTLRRWRTALLAYLDTDGASNGGTEAINGIIELGRRIAGGFRNFEHYRLRMLLITGGLDASPHTQL